MKVAFLTEEYQWDSLDKMWIPNGPAFYRCSLPCLMIEGAVMGRPVFHPRKGFGVQDGSPGGRFGFDVVVIKYLNHKKFLRQVKVAKRLGQRVVADIDDYMAGLHEDNLAKTFSDPVFNKDQNRVTGEQIALAADTITVSTPFLLDYFSSMHRDVRLVRNGVDLGMFPTQRKQQRKPVVGWVGITGWRSHDLEQMQGWMPDFMTRHNLNFHHGGYTKELGMAYEGLGLTRKDTFTVQSMVPITRLSRIMGMDIGIVPLNMIPFNFAKSYLKGLEYAASGIPFVASPTPEYRLLEQNGIGVTASSDEEWVEAVGGLLGRRARKRAAASAREALSAFTIQARADEWREVINTDKREPL